MQSFNKYINSGIDTSLIGLEKGDCVGGYFCTPKDFEVFGWEGSIHYGFLSAYGDMVFAVNPESCCESYVYPLAENFEVFLRLILFSKSTTAIEQISWFDKEQFYAFVESEDNAFIEGQAEALERIKSEFNLQPMEKPYEYVKNIMDKFDNSKIEYEDEYYDTLGLPRPDGTEREEQGFDF